MLKKSWTDDESLIVLYRKLRSRGRRVAKKVAAVVAVVAVVAAAAVEGRVQERAVRAQRPPVVAGWPIGLALWPNIFTIRTRPLASVFTINSNPHLSHLIRGTTASPVTWVHTYPCRDYFHHDRPAASVYPWRFANVFNFVHFNNRVKYAQTFKARLIVSIGRR